MNSDGSPPSALEGRDRLSYTDLIMSTHAATQSRIFRCDREGNSLGQSRLSMSEVQVCGIPKLHTGEVAST
jgi:hypothetical protein